jgi:hypothetical protein
MTMTERQIVKLLHEAVAQSNHEKSNKAIMTDWLDKIDMTLVRIELE